MLSDVLCKMYTDGHINTIPYNILYHPRERLIGQGNNIGRKSKATGIKCEKSKLQNVGKIQSDAGVTVDVEHIEVVELLKNLGSLKSVDGVVIITSWKGH